MSCCLVIGGAGGVWDDVEAALCVGEYDGVVAVNDISEIWPGPIDALVSYHPENFGRWIRARRRHGRPDPARVFAHDSYTNNEDQRITQYGTEWVYPRFPGQTSGGSSGLFAVKVALSDLKFDRAVLCGIPMTSEPGHFFNAHPWDAADEQWPAWAECLPHIRDRVRSMSGRTMALLGLPEETWVAPPALP